MSSRTALSSLAIFSSSEELGFGFMIVLIGSYLERNFLRIKAGEDAHSCPKFAITRVSYGSEAIEKAGLLESAKDIRSFSASRARYRAAYRQTLDACAAT